MTKLTIELFETSSDARVIFLIGMVKEMREISFDTFRRDQIALKEHFARLKSFTRTAGINADLDHIQIRTDDKGQSFRADRMSIEGAVFAICASLM